MSEEMNEGELLAAEIDKIKAEDPAGWEKAELEVAREHALNYQLNNPSENSSALERLVGALPRQINKCENLSELQTVMDKNHIPEIPEFELRVKKYYRRTNPQGK